MDAQCPCSTTKLPIRLQITNWREADASLNRTPPQKKDRHQNKARVLHVSLTGLPPKRTAHKKKTHNAVFFFPWFAPPRAQVCRSTSPATSAPSGTSPQAPRWPSAPCCSGPTRCSGRGCTTGTRTSCALAHGRLGAGQSHGAVVGNMCFFFA